MPYDHVIQVNGKAYAAGVIDAEFRRDYCTWLRTQSERARESLRAELPAGQFAAMEAELDEAIGGIEPTFQGEYARKALVSHRGVLAFAALLFGCDIPVMEEVLGEGGPRGRAVEAAVAAAVAESLGESPDAGE